MLLGGSITLAATAGVLTGAFGPAQNWQVFVGAIGSDVGGVATIAWGE